MAEDRSDDAFSQPASGGYDRGPRIDKVTGIQLDQWNRYMLPDPEDPHGKRKGRVRATTFASTVMDTFGVHAWELRMVAAGMGRRPDLVALAASLDPEAQSDKKDLEKAAKEALSAAHTSKGANLGTALHAFTKTVKDGKVPARVPDEFTAPLAAYAASLADNHIVSMIRECVVLNTALNPGDTGSSGRGVAGKFDDLLMFGVDSPYAGRLAVGDLKSAKEIDYSWNEIAIQLSIYANASHLWDERTETYSPMPPEVDKQHAIVLWCPVRDPNGQPIGTDPAHPARCELWEVDIVAGWEMAQEVCGRVREWRGRKNLARPLDASPRNSPLLPFLRRIQEARTRTNLSDVWRDATAAGVWCGELEAAGKRKLAEIAS